jgi:PST family polysaccharide transporter
LNSPEKNLAKNTFFLYLMQIANYVFPLLTFPYLTRVLGAEKYGVVVFGNAVMSYFGLFLEFGFILSATNLCSQYREDKEKLGNITFGVIYAKVILAVLGAIVLILCCNYSAVFKVQKQFFYLYYIGTALNIFLPDYLFRGIEKMSILTYRVLFSKFVYTALVFGLIHNSEDYCFVPVATIGGAVISVLLTWLDILRKKYISLTRISINDSLSYMKDASAFFISRVAVSMYTTLNTVLLGLKFPNAELALYGTANNLTNMCRTMISPISDSIYPYMVKNKNFKLVKKLIFIFEPVIIAGCILLYFIAPFVIRIVCGEGYDGAVPVLRSMLPLIVISLPTYLCGYPVLGALEKIKIATISVIFGSIFHIIGLFVLYFVGYMSFISVSLLTFATEIIVFSIRCKTIIKNISRKI